MDMLALTHPVVRDRDALQDFSDALKDQARAIESGVARLKRSPSEMPIVAELFRAVHNIKGDAALSRYDAAVLIVHPLENLLTRLRAREIAFSELLAEIILLTIDRVELAVESTLAGRPLEPLKLVALVHGLERLATLPDAELDAAVADLIAVVTGFRPASLQAFEKRAVAMRLAAAEPASGGAMGGLAAMKDLAFFQQLAHQLDHRSPTITGRSERVLQLALATNQAADSPLDPDQLAAATLLHDIGMMFLPDRLWLKPGKLNDEEKNLLQQHPHYAAGLLDRMPGWGEAARIVREHHEMPSGGGYPYGLEGDAICSGAKLLAIVDAFESVMQKQSYRGRSRSGLRAAAEVNANPAQFAPEWIAPFNRVIRQILER
jgi:HD-GYP domain-containing protein (c-di-GMP phosphodiesterase class II)